MAFSYPNGSLPLIVTAGWTMLLLPFPAFAQPVLTSVTLELIQVEREYRDRSNLNAAEGQEQGYLSFVAEFEDGVAVTRGFLDTPAGTFELDRDGDSYRGQGFVGIITSAFEDQYTVRVETGKGSDVLFTFDVDSLDFGNFPEVEFPIDGADELDSDNLEVVWNGGGDSFRLDLFDLFNNPQMPQATFRETAQTLELDSELIERTFYELWIGSTEETDGNGSGFAVNLWFTSSHAMRFSTGPDPRQLLPTFQPDERIDKASVGTLRERFGATSSSFDESLIASLEGSRFAEAELWEIRNPGDGRLLGQRMEPVETIPGSRFEWDDVSIGNGNAGLFLVEFETGLLGSEVAEPSGPLNDFPASVSPVPNASGLGPNVMVEWTYPATPDSFRVSIDEIGNPGSPFRQTIIVNGAVRQVGLVNLPPAADFLLFVSAISPGGSESGVCILVSTNASRDFDGDGIQRGRDLFGFSIDWQGLVRPNSNGEVPSGTFRLDTDGNELLNEGDLITFLETSRVD